MTKPGESEGKPVDQTKLTKLHSAKVGRIAERLVSFYDETLHSPEAVKVFNWTELKILCSVVSQSRNDVLLSVNQDIFIKDLNRKKRDWQRSHGDKRIVKGIKPVEGLRKKL